MIKILMIIGLALFTAVGILIFELSPTNMFFMILMMVFFFIAGLYFFLERSKKENENEEIDN